MQNSDSEAWNQYLEQCCSGSYISLFSFLPLVPRLVTNKWWVQNLGCPGRIDIWILKGVPLAFCASHWFYCMYGLENCKKTWLVLQEGKKGAKQLRYFQFMQKFALTLSLCNWEPQNLVLSPSLWSTAMTFLPFKVLFLKHGHYRKMFMGLFEEFREAGGREGSKTPRSHLSSWPRLHVKKGSGSLEQSFLCSSLQGRVFCGKQISFWAFYRRSCSFPDDSLQSSH